MGYHVQYMGCDEMVKDQMLLLFNIEWENKQYG